MPIRVQNDLPVKEILEHENIFVMDEYRAAHQDIRPIKIGLLNLMPLKEDTELQILRSLLGTHRFRWMLYLSVYQDMYRKLHPPVICISLSVF